MKTASRHARRALLALAWTALLAGRVARAEPLAVRQGAAAREPARVVVDEVALEAQPAVVPLPAPPSASRDPAENGPRPSAIERDGVVRHRFLESGQAARFAFEARAGELSLFELACWGYARAWSMAARISVLDERGEVLASVRQPGAVVCRRLLAFSAPRAGNYQVEVAAEEQFFRYVLVRHSSYAARRERDALALGGRELVHGFLADARERALFAVELGAGEEVAVKVLGTREEAKLEFRARVRGPDGPGAGVPPSGAMPMGGMMRAGGSTSMQPDSMRRTKPSDARQFQAFRVAVLDAGGGESALAGGAHYADFRPERAGTYLIEVSAVHPDEGGLFDLVLERGVTRKRVAGLVLGPDDEPLAGVELTFLREPDFDPVARATTRADGSYALAVPAAGYVLHLEDPARERARELTVSIEGARELNVLWP